MVSSAGNTIGQQLLSRRYIAEDQLNIALIEQKKTGEKLGRILLRYGFVSESRLRRTLGKMSGVASIDLNLVKQDDVALDMVTREFSISNSLLPVSFNKTTNCLTVAMSEPGNLVVQDRLRRVLGKQVRLKVVQGGESAIEPCIEKFYGAHQNISFLLDELEGQDVDLTTDEEIESRKIVRLVKLFLSDAVRSGASDLHLEPEQGFIRIRYRVDGVLYSVRSLHSRHWPSIAGRLKVLAGMDVAESRIPQDGSFNQQVQGKSIDFRVSSFPVLHGENMVLRILDRNKSVLGIEELQQSEATIKILKQILATPDGIILVAGPTGSGKTTTLYSLISELNTDSVNIMTLEDPVEYTLDKVRQSSIGKHSALSFHNGIRAIMRQDPDVVLIGEIRDTETALISLRAAMTGHKVFSSIHTRSALSTVQRLIDLGVQSSMLSGNLTAVIAQRLIRLTCTTCKGSSEVVEEKCTNCAGTGYKGRRALLEILRLDAVIDHMISTKMPLGDIELEARKNGWCPLTEQASLLLKQGLTDAQELNRVVGRVEANA